MNKLAMKIMANAWQKRLLSLKIDGVEYTNFYFSNNRRHEYLWLNDCDGNLIKKLSDHDVHVMCTNSTITDVVIERGM